MLFRRPHIAAGRILLAATIAALAAGGAGAAVAAIPGSDGRIDGCRSNVGGVLRVIDTQSNGKCHATLEKPIAWNQAGPAGAPGAVGPAGPAGREGRAGPRRRERRARPRRPTG